MILRNFRNDGRLIDESQMQHSRMRESDTFSEDDLVLDKSQVPVMMVFIILLLYIALGQFSEIF